MTNATFTKLKSGDWGIKVDGAVRPGAVVSVKKKSGDIQQVTVAKVVWSGSGVSICAISTPASSRSRSTGSSSGSSPYCGYPCPVTGRKCCAANGPCHDCE